MRQEALLFEWQPTTSFFYPIVFVYKIPVWAQGSSFGCSCSQLHNILQALLRPLVVKMAAQSYS